MLSRQPEYKLNTGTCMFRQLFLVSTPVYRNSVRDYRESISLATHLPSFDKLLYFDSILGAMILAQLRLTQTAGLQEFICSLNTLAWR